MKKKQGQSTIYRRLSQVKVGEAVTVGSYQWRKRQGGRSGVPVVFERVDLPRETHNASRMVEMIQEILEIDGKVEWPATGAKKKYKRLDAMERSQEILRQRSIQIKQLIDAANEAISGSRARIKKLEAEREGITLALDALTEVAGGSDEQTAAP